MDSIPFAAIADDFTGGLELAAMLAGAGGSMALVFAPGDPESLLQERCDAIVLCLKSRSIAPAAARQISRSGWHWLQTFRPAQLQFKYASTFDSTMHGNIGPVIEELMLASGQASTIAVPALPLNGCTQYLGHLFVKGVPLHESSMRKHPLNPMTDSNLVRCFGHQSRVRTSLIDLQVVRQGPDAINRMLSDGVCFIDATQESDLVAVAEAVVRMPLITGGSGIGRYLPALWPQRQVGLSPIKRLEWQRCLILSGSCSELNLQQVERLGAAGVTIHKMASDGSFHMNAVRNDVELRGLGVLSSSTQNADPNAAAAIESAFAGVARRGYEDWGVRQIIVAGGETSGAVVEGLKLRAARIVGSMAPGVPALESFDTPHLALVLKSGNSGGAGFFLDAKHFLDKMNS